VSKEVDFTREEMTIAKRTINVSLRDYEETDERRSVMTVEERVVPED